MTLSLRLVQAQRQTLAMTPQLMQAIKLLQMSNLELEAAVRDEVDRNPLLTLTSRRDGKVSAPRDGFARIEGDAIARVAERPSLRAHCIGQLASLKLDDTGRHIAMYLIDSLSEEGRLDPEIVEETVASLGVSPADVEDTLEALQGLSPAGLFARSLNECLALQLMDKGQLCSTASHVLDNLQLAARRDVRRLSELANCGEADVFDVMAKLKSLDPRPGLAFDTTPVQALEPEVIVRRQADGGYHVALDTTRLPKVLIDAEYHAEIAATGDQSAMTFANQCMRSAHWLTRSLDQRARTIVKVASAIVKRQREFFDGTATHVKPLTLREVAEDIGMHESTVSRVVSHKALASDRGIFPFRAFFAVAIDTTDGAVSADLVRSKIKSLVDDECSQNIRSDDEIVKLLKSNGIVIARRTVAKYREAMNIPSSVERRRLARHQTLQAGMTAQ